MTQGKAVELQSLQEGDQYAVAVKVHGVPKAKADRAVVTYQYWYDDSRLGRLLLTRTAVVEIVPDAFVMADGVTATRGKIKSIDVVLVKDVETHHFDLEDSGGTP